MNGSKIAFSVFTKPWKTMPLPELGAFIARLGFDGIELPVRPGFQVEPEHIGRDLPGAARTLAGFGVKIASVAGPTDEPTIAACGECGIPVIRVCLGVGPEGYMAAEAAYQREYDALVPALDRHGVTIGVQNHCDRCIASAMGLRHLVERFDRRHVGAVLDAAHTALNGEDPELAIDIVWSHLCLVNLKNAFWRRKNGPEAEVAQWETYWTSGRQGLASWPRYAAELKKRGYEGYICLTAEYSDEQAVNRLIAEDIAFAKGLWG